MLKKPLSGRLFADVAVRREQAPLEVAKNKNSLDQRRSVYPACLVKPSFVSLGETKLQLSRQGFYWDAISGKNSFLCSLYYVTALSVSRLTLMAKYESHDQGN